MFLLAVATIYCVAIFAFAQFVATTRSYHIDSSAPASTAGNDPPTGTRVSFVPLMADANFSLCGEAGPLAVQA
jgi:hypothetical protein